MISHKSDKVEIKRFKGTGSKRAKSHLIFFSIPALSRKDEEAGCEFVSLKSLMHELFPSDCAARVHF